MSDYLTKLLDELDACVFSGDLLYVDEDRKLLEHFLCRWLNAVADHKELLCQECIRELKESEKK